MVIGRSTFDISLWLGIALVLLGIVAYVLSEFASVTALIPTFFGVVIAGLAVAGPRTARERLAAYGIGLLAVLGAVGSARGLTDLVALLSGEEVESVIAPVSQGLMILVCLVLLVAVMQYLFGSQSSRGAV